MFWILLTIYFAFALFDVAVDGALCAVARRRFQLGRSLLAALVWPITAPLAITGAVVATRDLPTWKQMPIGSEPEDPITAFVDDYENNGITRRTILNDIPR